MNSDDNGRLDDTHQIGGCRVLYNTARQTNAKRRKLLVRVQEQGADAVCLPDKSCRATLIRRADLCGVHYVLVRQHNHPPHDEAIKHITHRNNLRSLSQSKRCHLLTTRSLASSARLETDTSRRLSTDLRFVRRVRQNKCCPRVPATSCLMTRQ